MDKIALAYLAAGIAGGLAPIGVGIGIGRLAANAMDATGRQPSATGEIRTSMLIAAALIEGVGLAGIVIGLLLAFK